MTTQETKEWIVSWFSENTGMDTELISSKFTANYFEESWIDSLKFIKFISDIEEKFNVTFSNDEFQNRSFATIEGLVKIVEDKKNEK
ncbi:acyl carrier protein [Methanobacterium ferruginis]|uniref:acyl carrier protein n=1 Tax=Methanobacterium ferruginis TaxID=710191 RepID=UPI0025738AC6|nr:acyl carrier protein [Methanobacterium ferruginis]BDZ68990.1 hypothetical protein GCM10025860_24380 [Methanobacterium ferruginis]